MTIRNRSKVEIGVVPTHLMFVGTLAPDESGKLPRTRSGDLKVVSGMRLLCRTSPVKLNNVQITLFPGTDPKDLEDMFKGFRSLKLNVHLIMMVGGANPLNPKDEDAVVDMLNSGLAVAKKYKVKTIDSRNADQVKGAALSDFQVFDLSKDVGEKEDLAKTNPAKLAELKKKLQTHYRELVDGSHVWGK